MIRSRVSLSLCYVHGVNPSRIAAHFYDDAIAASGPLVTSRRHHFRSGSGFHLRRPRPADGDETWLISWTTDQVLRAGDWLRYAKCDVPTARRLTNCCIIGHSGLWFHGAVQQARRNVSEGIIGWSVSSSAVSSCSAGGSGAEEFCVFLSDRRLAVAILNILTLWRPLSARVPGC